MPVTARHIVRTGLAAMVAAVLAAPTVQGADLSLRIADSFPSGHFIDRFAVQPFMARAEELSGGAVVFQHFPAQQLGKSKDMLALAQTGVVDMAYVGPSYVSDKMPLSAVAQLPGMFQTACEGTMAYWKLLKDGELGKTEFLGNDVVPIFAFVLPPYQIFTADQPIEGVASFEGQKLRATGGAMDITAGKLGAVPVRMSAPDVYEAISRGTLDGLIFPFASILAYDVADKLKYATVGENFGSFVVTYVVGKERWESLPDNVRDAIAQSGEETVTRTCASIDEDEAGAIAQLREGGMEIGELPEAEKAKVAELLTNVADEWAAELDADGKDGTATLQAFRDALAAGQ